MSSCSDVCIYIIFIRVCILRLDSRLLGYLGVQFARCSGMGFCDSLEWVGLARWQAGRAVGRVGGQQARRRRTRMLCGGPGPSQRGFCLPLPFWCILAVRVSVRLPRMVR